MTQRRIPQKVDSGTGMTIGRPVVGVETNNVGSTVNGFRTDRLIYDNRWVGGSKKIWYYDVDNSPVTTTSLVDGSVYGQFIGTGTQSFDTTITGTGLWTALGYAPSVLVYSPSTTTTVTCFWSWSGNFNVPDEPAANANRTVSGFTKQVSLTPNESFSFNVMSPELEIPYTQNSAWYYQAVEPKYQSGQATHYMGARNISTTMNVFAGMSKSIAEFTGGSGIPL